VAAALCAGLAAALGLTATVLAVHAMAVETGLRQALAGTSGGLVTAAAALAVLAGGLLGGWLARRSTGRLDVREQLRQLG